jgi:RNA polymerase sigma-70 factor (ECF subfamily)
MTLPDAAKASGSLVRRTSVNDRRPTAVDAPALAALAALYERRFRAFVGGAFAVVGEPEAARDVVQEAFARALRERPSFRAEGTLEAWLWRIVVNVARDVARRSRFADLSADELAEVATLGPDRTGASDLREELRDLPERQRLAVFLHYYADLPYDEVARLLEVAPGTVAASLNAARKTLRHRIEEAYE